MRLLTVLALIVLSTLAISCGFDDPSPEDLDDEPMTPGPNTPNPPTEPEEPEADLGPVNEHGVPYTVTVGGPPATCMVYEFPVPLEHPTWRRVPDGTPLSFQNNPPTTGLHYEMWAAWENYEDPVPRGYWLSNLYHGAIIIVYRPDAPAEVVEALTQAYDDMPPYDNEDSWSGKCHSPITLMTPDPDLDDTFAVLSYEWMLTSNCVPHPADIIDFAVRRRDQAPVQECAEGPWPVRGPCFRFYDNNLNEWTRVVPDGTQVTYLHNPPTSGTHYTEMARYDAHDEVIPRPYWVGNIAKGGVAILYRPDAAPEIVEELRRIYETLPVFGPCGHTYTLMTPDPELDTPLALVAYDQVMTAQCVEDWAVTVFVETRRGDALGATCEQGTYPPAAPRR